MMADPGKVSVACARHWPLHLTNNDKHIPLQAEWNITACF